jgi:hypothetical protein
MCRCALCALASFTSSFPEAAISHAPSVVAPTIDDDSIAAGWLLDPAGLLDSHV